MGEVSNSRFEGTTWVEETKLTASDGASSDWFGGSVSIAGDYTVIGANGDDNLGVDVGSAYIYSGFSTPSAVSVALTLSSQSGDGTFDYTVDLTNNTDSALTVDIWTEMSGPGGRSKIGSAITDKTLGPSRSYSETTSAGLGDGAPLGEYLFTVYVGDYPGGAISSASASYTKTSLAKGEALLKEKRPAAVELFHHYPDPSNPATRISYALTGDAHVTLKVYNMLGQLVKALIDEYQSAGYHQATWDGTNGEDQRVASGVYIYRLTAGESSEARRMSLLR
jgi:hypothetical protein